MKNLFFFHRELDFRKKVAIVGGGWYGCHIALSLAKKGYDVTIFEKNVGIFSGISGRFGIRLHAGPHYPRSLKTRLSCRKGFVKFHKKYPELINEHQYSIYGLGILDSDGQPPKVNKNQFEKVCYESDQCQKIDTEKWGYKNLQTALNLN